MLSIREVFKFSSRISAANAAGAVLSAGVYVLVARRLGPTGLGIVGLTQLWLLYAGFARPGILAAAYREILHALGEGRPDEAARLEGVALPAESAFMLFPLAAMLGAGVLWYDDSTMRSAMVAASATFLANTLFQLVDSVQWANQRFVLTARVNALMRVLTPACLLAGLFAGGLIGVLWAPAAASALGLAYYLTRSNALAGRWSWDPSEMRRLAVIGLPLALYGLLYWGFRTSDRMMVASLLTIADLGHFTFAMTFINQGCQWISDFLNVLQANLFGELGRLGSVRPLSERVQKIALLLLLVTGAGAGAAQALFDPLVSVFLPRFAAGVPTFEILSLNLVAITLPLLANTILISAVVDRQKAVTAAQAAGLAVNIGLGWALIRAGWGLSGIAWSSVISQLGVAGAAYALLHARLFEGAPASESRRFYAWQAILLAVVGFVYAALTALRDAPLGQAATAGLRLCLVGAVWAVVAAALHKSWWTVPEGNPVRSGR